MTEIRSPSGRPYFVSSEIGRGGFGVVVAASDKSGAKLAIKFRCVPQAGLELRRVAERELAPWVSGGYHPNIVTIRDWFVCQGQWLAIVMERAQGSLADQLNAGASFEAWRVCDIGGQALLGLNRLHSLGYVHMDVRPCNLLRFPDGVIKLSDFGIVKDLFAPDCGACECTCYESYKPPEVLLGGRGAARIQCDVYQLGMTLLTLMLGRSVIPSWASAMQKRRMILDGVPRTAAEQIAAGHSRYAPVASVVAIMLRRRWIWRHANCLDMAHWFIGTSRTLLQRHLFDDGMLPSN